MYTYEIEPQALDFTVVIKDVSEFGSVGLHGIHQIVEDEQDVNNIIYNVERDGFDRVFVYIRGLDSGEFDVPELIDLLRSLESVGGHINTAGLSPKDEWNQVVEHLTFKQYLQATTDNKGLHIASYRKLFERAYSLSKREEVRELCRIGLMKSDVISLID